MPWLLSLLLACAPEGEPDSAGPPSEDYADAPHGVPEYDFDLPPEGQEAPLFLGLRAPAGIRCPREDYLAGSCLPVR